MAATADTAPETRLDPAAEMPLSRVPNLGHRPFGTHDRDADAIEKRIVRKTGPEVPVALFQSSI